MGGGGGVDLELKSAQVLSNNCCSKKVCICSKINVITYFILAVKTLVVGTFSQEVGRQMVFSFLKIPE